MIFRSYTPTYQETSTRLMLSGRQWLLLDFDYNVMAWIYLVCAGLFEVGFTTSLKLSKNFTHFGWSVAFFISISLSFILLNKAVQHIPLGTAYAVWTGIGAVGTAIIGILFFQEPLFFWRVFFLVTLIASLVGLKVVS